MRPSAAQAPGFAQRFVGTARSPASIIRRGVTEKPPALFARLDIRVALAFFLKFIFCGRPRSWQFGDAGRRGRDDAGRGGVARFVVDYRRNASLSAYTVKCRTGTVVSDRRRIAFGYTAYAWLLARMSATRVASHAYVNPLVAVALGYLVAGEEVTERMLFASALVIVGVFLTLKPAKAADAANAGGIN